MIIPKEFHFRSSTGSMGPQPGYGDAILTEVPNLDEVLAAFDAALIPDDFLFGEIVFGGQHGFALEKSFLKDADGNNCQFSNAPLMARKFSSVGVHVRLTFTTLVRRSGEFCGDSI